MGPDEFADDWEADVLDDEQLVEPEPHTALPPRVEAWRQRSAAGAILTGFALGLQQALEPERDEPAIIVQTSGEPPSDLPVEADFEYRRPRQSVVNIRPWLLEAGQTTDGLEPVEGEDDGPSLPDDFPGGLSQS